MNKPRKHAALIKAWADGAEIEFLPSGSSAWGTYTSPCWDWDGDYRIKPEPKPDVVIRAPEGDIRALKHRIHELEGELIGYKKIVADQESIMTAQAMRIVDLKTHIENLEGED